MAKLFYTLEEASAKLGMTPDQVKALAESGQLQEFRDRDRQVFKVEQVDLLAGGSEEDTGAGIPLAADAESIGLASDSGAAMNTESPKEQSGISIFEADDTDSVDPSARTQVSETGTTDFNVDAGASGSGLLDLTREVEDTSLGRDLAPGGDEGFTAAPAGGGQLFESTGAESSEAGSPALSMVAAEPYDGAGSGIVGGLSLAVAVVCLASAVVVIGAMTGGFPAILTMVGGNFWACVGGMAGSLLLFGLIGWAIGRKT